MCACALFIKLFIEGRADVSSSLHVLLAVSLLFLTSSLMLSRLDAGTFGTMGVGLGFAIAAALESQHGDEVLNRHDRFAF